MKRLTIQSTTIIITILRSSTRHLLHILVCLFVLFILTYDLHSWPGSLTCHIYYDTGHPFIMIIYEDTRHSYLFPGACRWSSQYMFQRLRSVVTRDQTPICRMRGERSTTNPPRWSHILDMCFQSEYQCTWIPLTFSWYLTSVYLS